MLRRRVRSDSCGPAGVVPDNVPAPEQLPGLTPNWSLRFRRAIISIGFVWLSIGAGVTTYYTVTGQSSDTEPRCPHHASRRSDIDGSVCCGLAEHGAITRLNSHRPPDRRAPSAAMRTTAQPPEPALDRSWRTERWRISRSLAPPL